MKNILRRKLRKGISFVAACAIMATNVSPWLVTSYASEVPEEAYYEGADEYYEEASEEYFETPEVTMTPEAESADAYFEGSAEPTEAPSEAPDAAEEAEYGLEETPDQEEAEVPDYEIDEMEDPDGDGIAEGVEAPDEMFEEDAFEEDAFDEDAFENDALEDEAETPDGQILENAPSVIFEESTEEVRVTVVAGLGVFPEGTTMEVKPAEDEETISKVSESVEDERTKVTGVKAVDVTFYNAEHEEIEPNGPVFVTLEDLTKLKENDAEEPAQKPEEAKAVHVTDEGACSMMAAASEEDLQYLPMEWEEDQAEDSIKKIEQLNEEATVAFIAESFSTYALVYTVDFHWEVDGQVYEYSLAGGDSVSFRELVEMLGIVETAESENYEAVEAEPAEEASSEAEEAAAEEAAVEEPVAEETPAEENIPEAAEEEAPAEEIVEDAEVEEELAAVNAEPAEGLDEAVEEYTEENEEPAEVMIEEQSEEPAEEVVETVEEAVEAPAEALVEEPAEVAPVYTIDDFIDDVESIEFSDESLVCVAKVDEGNTFDGYVTAGELKEMLGLECEYSAELTEEQIAQMNDKAFYAPDWALISLQPFTSEETLTVTMKNGEVFSIQVTDAQISTHVITADGEDYIITVTYGPEAEIPDGARLEARELVKDTEEYNKHYDEAVQAINGATEEVSDENITEELRSMGLEPVESEGPVISFARFFDITIYSGDKIIEPSAPVEVSITYADPISRDQNMQAEVVHFAEGGVEVLEPVTDTESEEDDSVKTFTFEQSSFSVTATLLKYTDTVPEGKYIILRGGGTSFYALSQDGSAVAVTRNNDSVTYPNVPDACVWNFSKNWNGNYFITNNQNSGYRMVLYNNVIGNWQQEIVVSDTGNKSAVIFKNPNNQGLRWNSNNNTFYLGGTDGHAESFYLARVNSDVPAGRGYNLKPSTETDLGDLTAWRDRIVNSKIVVDKTASVKDYDNRIYQIDLKALSDVTVMTNKIDLELIVDTSRSMYFPATLNNISNGYFTSTTGNETHSLKNVVNSLNKNQIYYFIGDGEKATVYALYYAASGTNLNDYSGAEEWRYVDASYMNPPDASTMNQSDRINRLVGRNIEDLNYNNCNQTRPGGGSSIYVSPDGITRLAYLKEAVRIASEIVYAVDRNNRIGLVTFNSKATLYQNFTNYNNRQQLYNKIENISLSGGTRQDLGLQQGVNLYNNAAQDAQKIAILITDGAPNMTYDDTNNGGNSSLNKQQVPSDIAWGWIETDANNLKGPNSSKVKLYTLGLSLDFVGGNNASHLSNLASSEDGIARSFRAENGTEIANAVKNLIETLVYDVTLEAEVSDVLDPAFYPVDQNGNPIEPGTYTDQSGKTYTWSKETFNNVEHWKVTYINQDVGRGEKNADGTIKTPGWQKSFYVKAKEDFLGGNNIKTNRNASSDRVKAEKFVYVDKVTNETKKINAPSNFAWGVFKTPYVNVDELHLTDNSNEWTVYVGTEITPKEQLQILWNNIFVKQVVKAGGTKEDNTRITGDTQKYYSKTDESDTASPTGTPNTDYSALPISRYVDGTDIDWASMLDELKTKDSVEKTITYPGYGHNPGTITVKLEKTISAGTNAVGVAPGTHITDAVGTPAETYKITVTYTPQTSAFATVGDQVTLTGEDQVKSENTHIVNVFQKGIKITKVDKTNNNQFLTGAVFELYRTDTNGNADVSAYKLPAGKYSKVGGDLTVNSNGIIEINPVIPDLDSTVTNKALYLPNIQVGAADNNSHDTVFYLVEKTSPTYNGVTYDKMPGAIKFTLTLTENKGTDAAATLYNWTQTAAITAVEHENGQESYLITDEETNGVYAYRIKNGRPTDITLIKVDKDTGKSIGGAKFALLRGEEFIDLTQLTIKAIVKGDTITPETYDNDGTSIKVVTVPEGGIKIVGLPDDTYILREVQAPDGYILTGVDKTFKTENGVVKNVDGSIHQKETTDIDFKVENTPGEPLPGSGGPGTRGFLYTGLALIFFATLLGLAWRRKRI